MLFSLEAIEIWLLKETWDRLRPSVILFRSHSADVYCTCVLSQVLIVQWEVEFERGMTTQKHITYLAASAAAPVRGGERICSSRHSTFCSSLWSLREVFSEGSSLNKALTKEGLCYTAKCQACGQPIINWSPRAHHRSSDLEYRL